MIAGVKTNLSAIVSNILKEDATARAHDGYLYLKVLNHISEANGYSASEASIYYILKEIEDGTLPDFEAVKQAKIQAKMQNIPKKELPK